MLCFGRKTWGQKVAWAQGDSLHRSFTWTSELCQNQPQPSSRWLWNWAPQHKNANGNSYSSTNMTRSKPWWRRRDTQAMLWRQPLLAGQAGSSGRRPSKHGSMNCQHPCNTRSTLLFTQEWVLTPDWISVAAHRAGMLQRGGISLYCEWILVVQDP